MNDIDDNDVDQVATRYLGSKFSGRSWSYNTKLYYYNSMGRSVAQDVLKTFLNGVDKLDQSKTLQIASDGLNPNI